MLNAPFPSDTVCRVGSPHSVGLDTFRGKGDMPMQITKTIPLALVLAGFVTPTLAMNEGDAYVGGGLGMVNYDADGLEEAEPTVLLGRLGYFVVDNIAIEGRLGFGMSDDDITVLGTDVSFDVDQVAGVYGVGHLPIADAFSLYGLAGFTYAEGSASLAGISIDDDDTGFSYGLGGQYAVSDDVSAFIEWAQYLDESTYEVTGVTLGATFNF
jgi:opacity protein-like surface antigen